MKFEVKCTPSKNIEIFSIEIKEQVSLWQHWKALGIATLAGAVLVLVTVLIWNQSGLSGITVQNDRKTTVILRSSDGQERHSTSSNGVTTASH